MIAITRKKAIALLLIMLSQPLISAGLVLSAGVSNLLLVDFAQKAERAWSYNVAIAATKEGAKEPIKMFAARDLAELEQWERSNKVALNKASLDVEQTTKGRSRIVMAGLVLQILFALFSIWFLTAKPRRDDKQVCA